MVGQFPDHRRHSPLGHEPSATYEGTFWQAIEIKRAVPAQYSRHCMTSCPD
jgi:hypothetical protein